MNTIPSIKEREAAIYTAQRHNRAASPMARSRILGKAQSITLVMRYAEALGAVDKAGCQAEQERQADQIVSREKGWPTIDQIRQQGIERLKHELAEK